MAAFPNARHLAAYSSASAHGGVAAADPHKLIVMLMDGALERIARARGCMERKEIPEKAQLINRIIQIIGELRGSLDLNTGAEIAANLDALYDYMCRRLLTATMENKVEHLDEVGNLLRGVRDAWGAIPAEARSR